MNKRGELSYKDAGRVGGVGVGGQRGRSPGGAEERRRYFVFSYRMIQLIMIGKDHQKSQPCFSLLGDPRGLARSVKHSLASTALSANSLLPAREEAERRAQEDHPRPPLPRPHLPRALSSSTVDSAARAFEQLARNNKKSHLLKKYAQLKQKYEKIMQNSHKRTAEKNCRLPHGNGPDSAPFPQQQKEGREHKKSKKWELQMAPPPAQTQPQESISFCSEEGVQQVFLIVKYLSEGASGKVYLVRHAASGCVFSMKVIPRLKIGELNVQQLARELKIQAFLAHPNIVRLYHHHIDRAAVYLLLEPCLGQDLYTALRRRQGLPEKSVREVVRQVCQAVEHMHRANIIHRDIKPENILLHEDVVKICDFGWAVHSPLMRGTRCGTPLYASPEMVRQEDYDCKIDVWNIGVLTYELLYGNIPFEVRQLADLAKIIQQEVYFSARLPVSEYAKDFITGCLQKSPAKRFTIRQASEHQFLANLEKFRWTVV